MRQLRCKHSSINFGFSTPANHRAMYQHCVHTVGVQLYSLLQFNNCASKRGAEIDQRVPYLNDVYVSVILKHFFKFSYV